MDDNTLLALCGIPPDSEEATAEVKADLATIQRLIASAVRLEIAPLDHAVALLVSVLANIPKFNPEHHPFGYEGPTTRSVGWVEQGIVERIAIQLAGLTFPASMPSTVARVVTQSISEALGVGFLNRKEYDAWVPGMASGTGLRTALQATTYGVIRARTHPTATQSKAGAPPAPPPPSPIRPTSADGASDASDIQPKDGALEDIAIDDDPLMKPAGMFRALYVKHAECSRNIGESVGADCLAIALRDPRFEESAYEDLRALLVRAGQPPSTSSTLEPTAADVAREAEQFRCAVRWLRDRYELPSRLGDQPEGWVPGVFLELAELIERKAGVLVLSYGPADAPQRPRAEMAANRFVRCISELKIVNAMPAGAMVPPTATAEAKQNAQTLFDRWYAHFDRLIEDSLNLGEVLLEAAGPGIGTGLKAWIKRWDHENGGDTNPFNDNLLTNLIDEAEAIGRLASVAFAAAEKDNASATEAEATSAMGRHDDTAPSRQKRRGRLCKAVSEAKRAHFLATIREHRSLQDDPPHLAKMFSISQSTARRWVEHERTKYLECQAARSPHSHPD